MSKNLLRLYRDDDTSKIFYEAIKENFSFGELETFWEILKRKGKKRIEKILKVKIINR